MHPPWVQLHDVQLRRVCARTLHEGAQRTDPRAHMKARSYIRVRAAVLRAAWPRLLVGIAGLLLATGATIAGGATAKLAHTASAPRESLHSGFVRAELFYRTTHG